jgi:hypothetical protein
MFVMKKKFSVILAAILTLSVFSISVFAADSKMPKDEGTLATWAGFDLTEFSGVVKKYKADPKKPDIFAEVTDKDKPKQIMDTICDSGYILLPSFVDISAVKKGEIFVKINSGLLEDSGSDLSVSGIADGYEFSLLMYINQSEFMPKRKEPPPKMLPQKYYEQKNDIIRTVVDGIEIISYAPGRFPYYDDIVHGDRNCYFEFSFDGNYYILTVVGIEHYDELLDNFGLQIYPLDDGFIRAGGEIYYAYNGKFLSGWYKISGSRYYFKKDNTAARGVTLIGGKCYMFAEDGKYIGLFTGTAKIGGKTYRFVEGVAKK